MRLSCLQTLSVLAIVPSLLEAFSTVSFLTQFSTSIHRSWTTPLSAAEDEIVNDGSPETPETSQSNLDEGRKHDMSERFRYSVNAMMGTFDPRGIDDERQDGNILQAVLNFPANFTFSAVGKTNGDMNLRDEYAEEVKNVIKSISGGDEYCSTFEVVPRGSKFTKVLCVVEVQSATMINTIYEDIANLQKTVMRF